MSTLAQDKQAETSVSRRPTKNEKKRMKKKEGHSNDTSNSSNSTEQHNATLGNANDHSVEIEYIGADFDNTVGLDPLFSQFKDIFNKFARPEELMTVDKSITPAITENINKTNDNKPNSTNKETTLIENKPLSKRKRKLLSRLSVAELKQLVSRPDVVEVHDVTSMDPKLLVYLKSYRNTVSVPRHWCHIRKYLQGKRGVEKIPFQLPEYIADTGIARIRDTILEQELLKKGKQKARERVRPKMGKIDIDYQVLHDAFFKYQTKPKLSGHGDLYYEGKEFEVKSFP
jgi:splicing factor 3B subunit 2